MQEQSRSGKHPKEALSGFAPEESLS